MNDWIWHGCREEVEGAGKNNVTLLDELCDRILLEGYCEEHGVNEYKWSWYFDDSSHWQWWTWEMKLQWTVNKKPSLTLKVLITTTEDIIAFKIEMQKSQRQPASISGFKPYTLYGVYVGTTVLRPQYEDFSVYPTVSVRLTVEDVATIHFSLCFPRLLPLESTQIPPSRSCGQTIPCGHSPPLVKATFTAIPWSETK